MDFSMALHELRKGARLTNTEWSNPNQYIVMMGGYPEGVPANKQTQEAHHLPDEAIVKISPYIVMCRKGIIFPWTPSQADLFSYGWEQYYSAKEIKTFRNEGTISSSVSDWPHP
jgi:hypothetical protein